MNNAAVKTKETPVKCAWCEGQPSNDKASHGICPACYHRLMTETQQITPVEIPRPVVLMKEASA